MKHFLSAILIVMSSSAYADYFGCDLNVNGMRAGEEAEYRGREVSVTLADYTCDAVIDNNIIVTTTVTAHLTNSYSRAGGRASAAVQAELYNPSTDSIDLVFCKCGLR